MDGAKFKPGDKVLHRSAKRLGVGTVLGVRLWKEHPVPGFWYRVDFPAQPERKDEWAEQVLRLSPLDQLAAIKKDD